MICSVLQKYRLYELQLQLQFQNCQNLTLVTIVGSSIDHVYIHQDLLGNVNVEVKKFDVFFSDHDAIQISLTGKSDN